MDSYFAFIMSSYIRIRLEYVLHLGGVHDGSKHRDWLTISRFECAMGFLTLFFMMNGRGMKV